MESINNPTDIPPTDPPIDHHRTHEHQGPPREGHHHPRQPADATGLPPNHRPRSDVDSTAEHDISRNSNTAELAHHHHHQNGGDESGEQQQPRRGHHLPRQPVGATGLPPNHRPREDFTGNGVKGSAAGEREVESGNNFPGTNPDPEHSASG